ASTYEAIKREYRIALRDERSDLVIFAITDPNSKTTFLLPEFDKLSTLEKQVILFHETIWVLYPSATYYQVARLDAYLQNYLKTPNLDTQYQFISALDGFTKANRGKGGLFVQSLLGTTLRSDLRTGALKGLVSDTHEVRVGDFLGTDARECFFDVYLEYDS